jgi:hypothetical protein
MTYMNGSSLPQVGQFQWLKSFLMWAFALTVFMIVVGFPMLILVVTVASLLAMVLQSVLPMSAVLLVSSVVLGAHLLAVVVVSAVLTFRGIHPHEVSWLNWLKGSTASAGQSVYASCPLTCEVHNA